MKKQEIHSLLVLAMVLMVYLVLSFVIPFNHTGTFWLGFVFGLVGIGLGTAGVMVAFQGKRTVTSKFYGFPIVRVALIYTACQLIVSFLLMGLSFLPAWVGVVVCIILFALAVIGLVATDATRDEIERQDAGQKINTQIMIGLRARAEVLAEQFGNDDAGAELKKLAEDLRSSDPVSSTAAVMQEMQLEQLLGQIGQALRTGDNAAAMQLCRDARNVLAERNGIAVAGKGR